MRNLNSSKWIMLLALLVVGLGSEASYGQAEILLASTNAGELVEIDLVLRTARLVGAAGPPGWSDLTFGPDGDLYAVSRSPGEPISVCFGYFSRGSCSHLYRLDPDTGQVLQHVGDLEVAYLSDVDGAEGGFLYGNRYVDQKSGGDGGLVTIDPATATTTQAPNLHFGPGLFGVDLNNGGLAVHPSTGAVWAVESSYVHDPSIFRVDPNGLAVPPFVRLGLNGSPTPFGFDGLEILANGRFLATRAARSSEIYEIVPTPDAVSGLAEVFHVPLDLDPAIAGNLTGLTSRRAGLAVDIDVKPGSDPNCFNLNGHGVIPVGIHGSEELDVGDIEFDSLLLDGLEVRVRGNRGPMCSFENLNGDSYLDLVCQFEDDAASWTAGQASAQLTGELLDGTLIEGEDSICIVP